VVRNVDSRDSGHGVPVVCECENLRLYLSAQALIKPFGARIHPCRCLCRGFGQMTRTTPLRRMILQLRQILFTDAITFMYHLHGASRRR